MPRLYAGRWKKGAVVGAALAALTAAGIAGAAPAADALTVVRNVTVVDTRDGTLAPGMAVVIEDGRIARVAATASVESVAGAREVDAAGKYVVPGYLDMHTHALPMADGPVSPWPLMLANGITGIREMSGSPAAIERAGQVNADIAAGRLDAPEILQMPSDLVVGLPSPDMAAGLVSKQKADGASFIKVVNARPDVMLAILEQAREQSISVAGHLPVMLRAQEAAAAGWGVVEHLGAGLGVLLDCSSDAALVRESIRRGEGAKPPPPGPESILSPLLHRAADAPLYRRVLDSLDEARCAEVAQAFVEHGTWHAPTLIRLRTMFFSDAADYRQDPNLRYVDKGLAALWQQLAERYEENVPSSAAQTFQAYYAAEQQLARQLKRSGVKMLAGSDVGGIWVIPGFSLHQEFRELAVAGFSPLEVLQMATLNGAEFLGRADTMGTVEAGRNADLVLLDANPLERVENLSAIAGVFLKGRYFSGEALDGMKEEQARAVASQPAGNARAALDAGHVH